MRALVVVFLVLAVTAGCGSGDEPTAEQTAPSEQTSTATEPSTAASNREAAPPLSGKSIDGRPIALADFRGRPVLVNVWSSW